MVTREQRTSHRRMGITSPPLQLHTCMLRCNVQVADADAAQGQGGEPEADRDERRGQGRGGAHRRRDGEEQAGGGTQHPDDLEREGWVGETARRRQVAGPSIPMTWRGKGESFFE